MKHFNRHSFAIVPLLTLLSMSPSVLEKQHSYREIASVNEEISATPKFDAMVSKVDQTKILKDPELTIEKFKSKRDGVLAKLQKTREEFKKEQADKVIVDEQRKLVEELVVDILVVDGAKKDLSEQKKIEESDSLASDESIKKSKEIAESLIGDLEANEVLVAKASEPKVEEEPKKEEPVVVSEEPKKEEPKKDEPVVASEEPKKEEPKKEEPKKEEEKKPEVCESDEKNKVLTAQVQDLMKQNDQIMKTMMGMMQIMISMHQQQQQTPPNPYYNSTFPIQNPYTYNQPTTAGNWVYYPQGFQPQQPNIFAAPQPQMGGYYPDMMYQQQQYQPQNNWMLQPTMSFDPRYSQMPMQVGSFGNDAFSFNMGNQVPTVSQAPMMPQQQPMIQQPQMPMGQGMQQPINFQMPQG